jgi:hypothetical protein
MSASSRGSARRYSARPPHTDCTSARTGTWATASVKHTCDTTRCRRSRTGPATAVTAPSSPASLSSSSSRPVQQVGPPQRGPQLLLQTRGRGLPAAGQRPDHHAVRRRQLIDDRAGRVPQPPRDPMSLHRRTHRLCHHKTNLWARSGVAVRQPPGMDDNVGLHGAHAVLDRRIELRRPLHPVSRGEHRSGYPRTNQAVSSRRPLRRRFDTIARPARVRIRSRNPCTRARRRLLGWKVRLPLATALSPCYVWHPTDARTIS